ncbi:MAG: histidinol dehydrogenase, partial [Acidobacteriota bacterium]
RRGAIIITRSERESLALANRIAPEHLTLVDDAKKSLSGIRSAGSVFLGEYSAVAAGDYASGTNHILPTGAAARVRGGLSAADFVKTISVQRLTREGLAGLRSAITTLARAEGMEAHARSVEARFESRD